MTPRIFVDPDDAAIVPGAELALPPPAARHAAYALRLRVGEPLTVFDGAGGEYAATITRIDRRDVMIAVLRHEAIERESIRPLTLVQASIAADMMDWVIRKSTELGVAAIVPVQSARTQGIPAERAARRGAHWREIAIAACEQCGRNRLPSIAPLVSYADWIAAAQGTERIVILDSGGETSLAASAAGSPVRVVAIGPEGGFTPDELDLANRAGATRAHLGPRILRAETAAIAALAMIDAFVSDAAGR